jgi:hypothetical protein
MSIFVPAEEIVPHEGMSIFVPAGEIVPGRNNNFFHGGKKSYKLIV